MALYNSIKYCSTTLSICSFNPYFTLLLVLACPPLRAILFPAIKYKTVPLEPGEVAEGDRSAEDGDPTPAGMYAWHACYYIIAMGKNWF